MAEASGWLLIARSTSPRVMFADISYGLSESGDMYIGVIPPISIAA